jgi:hypothetical protein
MTADTLTVDLDIAALEFLAQAAVEQVETMKAAGTYTEAQVLAANLIKVEMQDRLQLLRDRQAALVECGWRDAS